MPFLIRPYRHFPVPCSVSYNAGPFLKLPLPYIFGFWLQIALLVLSSGPVYAKWMLVSGEDKIGLTVYVDPDTIQREGNLVKMWSLIDYKKTEIIPGDSLLSIRRQNEYDCTEERTRMLASMWFSGNMGSGRVVHSDSDEGEWKPVAPGSASEGLLKIACGKE